MRERRKEPREGSEIDPETACIQTVGAQLNASSLGSLNEQAGRRASSKERFEEIDPIAINAGGFGVEGDLVSLQRNESHPAQ